MLSKNFAAPTIKQGLNHKPSLDIIGKMEPLCSGICGYEWAPHFSEWESLASEYNRLLIVASRDSGKSTFWSKLLPIINVITRPGVEILLVSYSEDQVIRLISGIKELFESKPIINSLIPSGDKDWSKTALQFKNGSKINSLTFGSSGRGQHVDVMIVDDAVKDFAGMNPDEQYSYFTRALVPMVKPSGNLIVIGTYVYSDDLIERLERNTAYHLGVYPAIKANGEALWPSRWPIDKLEERRIEVGDFSFGNEYLLQKQVLATQFFKRSHFQYYNETQIPDRLFRLLSVDPAISTEGDYTAITVTGTDDKNKTYLLEYANLRTDNIQYIVDEICRLVQSHSVPYIQVETIGFQKVLKHWLYEAMRQKNHHFGIEEIRTHTKSKEARIMALQPRIAAGSLLFHPTKHEEIINQFLAFPKGLHDDLCLIAGTKIATPCGDKSIESIKKGDNVLTPLGVRTVLAARQTGVSEVISAHGLTGKSSHPVFSNGNFESLGSLNDSSIIDTLAFQELLQWRYRKLLSSMAYPTASWVGKEGIISVNQIPILAGSVPKDFMLRFGSFITKRQFKKVSTFTIKTAILLITALKTLSVYQLANILECQRISIWKNSWHCLRRSGHLLRHGIAHLMAKSGIAKILKNSGPILGNLIASAFNAAMPSSHFILCPSGVPLNAKERIDLSSENAHYVQKNFLHGSTVTQDTARLNVGLQPVYNLTVDQDNCYYANGVLVGNCDSLAFQVGKWDQPGPIETKKPYNSFDWWKEKAKVTSQEWQAGLNV